MVPGPKNIANWSARVNNLRKVPAIATVPGVPPFTVIDFIGWTVGVPDIGPPVIDYAPPPFDLVSSGTGLPAVAFTDFPMAVI